MTGVSVIRGRRFVAIAVMAGLAGSLLAVTPAVASSAVPVSAGSGAAAPAAPASSGQSGAMVPAPSPDPVSARAQADAQVQGSAAPVSAGSFVPGVSSEVVADRLENMKVFTNPDGSHTAEISSAPLNFRDPSRGGAWSAIDSSVVSDPGRSGWLRSKANSWTVRFGPTPMVEFDSASGGVQTMVPVGAAAVRPVVGPDPDTVTYDSVWPNVDLRYLVSASGVKEDIVVNGPPVSTTFYFSTGTTSYQVASGGGMTPVGAASDAAWLAAPVVTDAAGASIAAAGPVLAAAAVGGGPGVEVSLAAGWTPSSYPYVIDPSFSTGSPQSHSYRSDGGTCNGGGGCAILIGNSRSAGNTYWRAVVDFPLNSILGDATQSAYVNVSDLVNGTSANDSFFVTEPTAWSYAGAGNCCLVATSTTTGGNFSSSSLNMLINSWTESGGFGPLGFEGQETAGVNTYKQFNAFTLYATYYSFPTSPSPSGPGNGGTFHTLAPTLSASSTNSDGTGVDYYYRVATGSNAESGVVCNSGWLPGATNWSTASCGLNWNTTYYWHAYAWDGQYDAAGNPIQSAPGPVWSFTTQNRPPTAPGLVSPGSTSTTPWINTTVPSLVANASTDPDGDPISYDFQVATGSNGQTGVLASSGWQSGTSWTPPAGVLQNGGTYYWTAEAEDNYGFTSGWSSALGFTIDTTAPAAPSISSSTDPSQSVWYGSGSFAGTWSPPSDPSGIVGYSVVLDNSPSTIPATAVTQTSTSYSTTVTSGVWYLHVRAKDSAGNWGATGTYSFHVEVNTPTISSPTSGGTSPGTETLTALSGPDATGATFEIFYKGSWQTLASTTAPGSSTWTTTWNTAATSNGSYVYGDGPYLVGVQLQYGTNSGQLTAGPIVWITNHGPTLANETTGGSNPSEPDVVPPSSKATDAAANATIDEGDGELDTTVTDTQTLDQSSLPPEIIRSYSSARSNAAGPFGYGWTGNYNLTLNSDSTYGSAGEPVEDVVQENGSVIRFAQDAKGNWSAPSQVSATLSYNSTSGQWTMVRNGQNSYVFSSAGQLKSISDSSGYSTTFTYTGSELTTVTAYTVANYLNVQNPTSLTLTLGWGVCGSAQCVTTVTDPGDRIVHYSYNSAGYLTGVEDVASHWTYYGYDTSNRLNSIEDPAGPTTSFGYNASSQVASETDPNGQVSGWTYSLDSYNDGTVTYTDPRSNQTGYTLANGLVTTENQPQSSTTTATYPDASPGPSTITTGAGSSPESTSVTYNPAGAANPNAGAVSDITLKQDAAGNTTETAYNANNNAWCTVNAADYLNGIRCPSTPPASPPGPTGSDPDPGMTINFYTGALLTATVDPLGNVTT